MTTLPHTIRAVPRRELLTDDQRRQLERAGAAVARAERALADAQQRRRELVADTLAEVGAQQRGALAAVARASGLTPEAVRQIHRNPDAPWER